MHGEGQALALRKGDAFFFTVARGPVPRDLSISAENVRSPETADVCGSDRCMARDRPSPYGAGKRFFLVARGHVTATLGDL